MMAPQVAQLGASPMSYMDFMASATWMMPRSSNVGREADPSAALRDDNKGSGAIPCCGGVVV